MKILFLMRHPVYVRMWEHALAELGRRGHRIHIGFEKERAEAEIAERLSLEHEGISFGYVPLRRDQWRALAYGLRRSIDYLRYLEPEYQNAWKLRLRARRGVFGIVLALVSVPPVRSRSGRRALRAFLRFLDRRIPTATDIDRYLMSIEPDAVLATPLVNDPGQRDYMRSARALGKVCVLPVNSWDNLTNKGLVQESLDRVYVWNDIQKGEAVDLHGIPSDRVAVVGAHSFDHWFGWKPSTTREQFCRRVGLDPGKPYVLYVGSSAFIVDDERPVVMRWLEAVRGSGFPQLATVGVLVRPHPAKPELWLDNPVEGAPDVAVWPRAVSDPRNDQARSEYFDSLYHAALVVGLNTSALIEAAIVGRPSYTFTLPELSGGQEGTLHFHYLARENGGPLTVGSTLTVHVQQLASALADPAEEGWNDDFLVSFLRPLGLDHPSAPILADDLERTVAETTPVQARAHRGSAVLAPVAWLADGKARRRTGRKLRRRLARLLRHVLPRPVRRRIRRSGA